MTAFMSLTVEADGPVRQALWTDYALVDSNFVNVGGHLLAPGKSSGSLAEVRGGHLYRTATFGGDDTLLRPPILYDRLQTDPNSTTVWAGSDFYYTGGHQLRVFKWDGTDMGVAAYDSPAYSPMQWVGPTLLFAYASSPYYEIVRWTEHDGTRVLIGFGSDYSKGAGYPGSDGKDLVWLQGENRDDDSVRFPVAWVMTSKFSTNASEIQPRKLTRWPQSHVSATDPAQVGCGHAALSYSVGWPKGTEAGMLIVRLSDGVSWKLVSPSPPTGHMWVEPIAITCNEVFARYKGHAYETIRRVRLDSLGPGTPPSELVW